MKSPKRKPKPRAYLSPRWHVYNDAYLANAEPNPFIGNPATPWHVRDGRKSDVGVPESEHATFLQAIHHADRKARES